MSTILKGIDLPRNGDCHHITIYDNGNTYITTSNVLYETDRKDVEAIQIPKGHGRLIDADALVAVFKDMAKCEWNQKAFPISWAYAFEDTIDEIHGAPTILEAEE